MKKNSRKIITPESNGVSAKKVLKKNTTARTKNHKPGITSGKSSKPVNAEQELALLLNNTEEGFVVVGIDLTILTFNNEFKNLYRKFFGKEIRKNKSILDYAPKGRKEIVEQIYHKVFSGEKLESETELTSSHQRIFTFSNKFKPAYDEAGNIIGAVVTTVDITEKKKSELLLTSNEQRFRALVENSSDGIIILSVEGKTRYVSPAVEYILGYTEEEAIQLDMYNLLHPDDLAEVQKTMAKAMVNPGIPIDSNPGRVLHKDGTWRWLEATITNMLHDPSINGIVDNFRDVTEKIVAEQALRDNEEKTRLIMNASLDAIICMNAKGVITFWNPQAEKIFGWTAEEVMGRVLSDIIIPPDFRELHNKGFENYLKTGHGPALNVLLELSAINRDNKEFPVELTILPIRQGNEEFFCAFIRDITTRKFIKQQLSDALNFNQAIIETSPVGIWIYEESGQAISVNKAGVELGGTDIKDLLSLNFRELEAWKKMGLYDAAIEALETGKMVRKEIHGFNRLNNEIRFEALLSPVQFKGKKHLMLMTYDIMDRMVAEEELKKSKTQLSVATELAKLGYWELNIAEAEFTFNDQFFSILKTSAKEMGGYKIPAAIYGQRFLHPDDGQLIQDEIRMAIETTDPNYSRHIEHRIIYADGKVGHLAVRFFVVKDEQGRTIKTIGANQDVTEQVMAAEQIRLSKERYEMVHKATNDAIYEWDIVNNVNYWGEGYETLFGHKWTGEKMDATTWSDNLHPDDKEELIATAYKAFQEKRTSLKRELRFRCADGSYKTVIDKLIILYNAKGEPLKIVGAMRDITALKKNEIAISELNERLNKRADELASSNSELERFAYVASHDLQEPLRMVSSFLQLLEKKYKGQLDETATQYISYAVDGADRMKRLILDLLEYSRVGTKQDNRTKTDLNEVAKHVLEIFADKTQETNAVITIQPLPVINVNKVQLTQLIQNLIGNAFKYNKAAVPVIGIGCEEKKDEWQFFVKDNGIGIESKFFEKVFVIFQRLHNKNQFSGTGIGLAICKKIVERHGGTIWIESSPGNGSTFFFTIKK